MCNNDGHHAMPRVGGRHFQDDCPPLTRVMTARPLSHITGAGLGEQLPVGFWRRGVIVDSNDVRRPLRATRWRALSTVTRQTGRGPHPAGPNPTITIMTPNWRWTCWSGPGF